MSIIAKIFGDANEKYVKGLEPLVEKINSLEKDFEGFSDEKLKEKTGDLKEGLAKGDTLEDILPEAFALAREASKRTLGQRHFDVQLIGGIVLHQGKIAEMKTGEGKTLTATLPIFLNALAGKGCHLVTVNDYLARRDAVWMGQIYRLLGLSVGILNHEQSFLYDPDFKKPPEEKEKQRDALGSFFVVEDFLRPCSRKEAYGADITYGTNNEYGFDYLRDNMAYDSGQQVQRGYNFAIVDEVDSILIDEARTPLIISAPDMESSRWYQEFSKIIPKLDPKTDYQIDEKMKAVTLTEGGIGKIEQILGGGNIYEEKGIKYVHHLEQALRAEALFKRDRDYVVKDGQVVIVDEFTGRLMPGRRWSGGLHQAIEAKENVQVQPESLTLASITFQNYFRMYKKLAGMTGTASTSAEEFDKVYKLEVVAVPTNKPMVRRDLADKIFKTEQGKFEALVREIKERNQKGQPVLVGTTSIVKNEYLGKLLEREGVAHQVLNAKNHEKEGEIIAQAGKSRAVTIATNMAGRGVDIILGGNPASPDEALKVREAGGLHVIGTERHEARRIDNQLRGRSGRQGDPGSSQFFVSLEDDLMRIFGGDRIKSLMTALKIPENEAIESGLVSRAIEEAQSKVEGMNFDLRKHVLEYDDVMNKHREVIYKKRREMLEVADWKERIVAEGEEQKKALEEKIKELGDNFNQVARFVSLRVLDMLWIEHLENMEYLRDSVRLRAYGQRDPLVEYKTEGHKMFQQLLQTFEKMVVETVLKASLKQESAKTAPVSATPSAPRVGRNDPCPCGSGKKYKRCGAENTEEHQRNIKRK
ncbi:MAG: preprotein translocase subunit SecA [Candidatus Nealsonbacteria bacterium]|nr:preprotein translocase subunit SecA [Candidatus Nealsonbacteria bacterium]